MLDLFLDFLVFLTWVLGGVIVSVPVIAFIAWLVGLLRYLTVDEGTAVYFKFLGRAVYCAMQFINHHFKPDGSIDDGPGPSSYGSCWLIWRIPGTGLVFYLWPFVQPANYSDYNDPDGFGDGIRIRLGDRTSEPTTLAAETADPENVGLNIPFVSTRRVVNPYLYLIVAPRDVAKQVDNREEAVMRAWVKSGDQKHAQASRGNGEKLWNEIAQIPDANHPNALNCLPIFEGFKNGWGMEVLPNSIIVKDVGYDADYQAALKARSQEVLLAKAKVAKIAAIDRAMDKWVRLQAKRMKVSVKTALKTLKADGSWQRQRELYMAQILVPDADVVLVGNPDGTPLSGNLGPIGALAALFGGRGRGPRNKPGNPGNPGGQGQQKKGGKKKIEDMTPEELREEYRRLKREGLEEEGEEQEEEEEEEEKKGK